MEIGLSPKQQEQKAAFRAFVDAEIVPHADRYDREERIHPDLIARLARAGYLGSALPKVLGGAGLDTIAYGLLHEEMGRGCSSVRSLLTVHGMVASTLFRWGSRHLKEQWLPRLASGEAIAAFGLSEPNVGSDAKHVETEATLVGDSYVLNGHKKWISFGQIADIFLVVAQCAGQPAAFLVERNSPGLAIRPISGLLGLRASMLAELELDGCQVPAEHLVGRIGFGFSHIAATALDHGRYSVAWGCVGIGQACLDASLRYSSTRKQFGVYLKEHQLIQQMIADMITNLQAARLLCYHAGCLRDAGDPRSIAETSIAKYFASVMVNKAASDSVQIHGANGCSSEFSVQRFLRDAKIMEIIEGSTQLQQVTIAQYAYQRSTAL